MTRDTVETIFAALVVAILLFVGFKVLPRKHDTPPARQVFVAEIALFSDGTVRIGQQVYKFDQQARQWAEQNK